VLGITKRVKKIKKASAICNEIRTELNSAVILCNDILAALESPCPSSSIDFMEFIPKNSTHLGNEFNQISTLLMQSITSKISYTVAAKKMTSWRNELLQNINFLAKFE
jgi:hypothetical protein